MVKQNRIGVGGSGFIARGFVMAIDGQRDLTISRVLTRSEVMSRSDFPRQDLLTTSVNELIDNSDIVLECSGDAIYGTEVIEKVMSAAIPVVTMNAELQVTTGSYFARKGFITEAEGDQPGCIAALREDLLQMGFKPLVYGNIKGFLNYYPTKEEMDFWAKKQGISMDKVISFTDGTKVQIEQTLVANGLGCGIVQPGLLGYRSDDLTIIGNKLAEHAKNLGYAISEFVLSSKLAPGVFIVAEHDERQKMYLTYFKLGNGPFYVLLRNYHLCHLEIVKTIRRVLCGGGVLINNTSCPKISVGAIAKRTLSPGDCIVRGIGSFDVRGSALRISENPNHVPIGLIEHTKVTRRIENGQIITFQDIEIEENIVFQIWQNILSNCTCDETIEN